MSRHTKDGALLAHVNYMSMAFREPPEQLAHRIERLIGHRRVVDTLVGSGMSGALVVPPVARIMGLHWCIVRKPGEHAHSGAIVIGELGHNWVFVDDFISGGGTFQRVYAAIHSVCEHEVWDYNVGGIVKRVDHVATFKGTAEYQHDHFRTLAEMQRYIPSADTIQSIIRGYNG